MSAFLVLSAECNTASKDIIVQAQAGRAET